MWWAVVDAGGDRYQCLLGERPDGEVAEFLNGQEDAVLGVAGDSYFYDGTVDAELSLPLLEMVSGGSEHAERVRPIGGEQSNTSLVYDDRLILKLYRRLSAGVNPDVEVSIALAAIGFENAAAPLANWREAGWDLALVKQFLAGSSEGWALALTSLRDLYGSESDDPAESGGDFASEAGRLGVVTGEMHKALAQAFVVDSEAVGEEAFHDVLSGVEAGLAAIADRMGPDFGAKTDALLSSLRSVQDPGPAIRVHGDYHLGQVVRTDTGWYVLDFEGEPARSLDERRRPSTPLRDVAGMLRSFQYAARFALRARAEEEVAHLEARGDAWEQRTRMAFLEGYQSADGIDELLPRPGFTRNAVTRAFELEKALYELEYERAHRPDWEEIPRLAIRRLVEGGEVAPERG
jgi:maltokinase